MLNTNKTSNKQEQLPLELEHLLDAPFIPKDDEEEVDYELLEKQYNISKEAIKQIVLARQAKYAAGTTSKGKLRVELFWTACYLRAYVVERRGKGLLVQADNIQTWLPADKVYIVNRDTIDIPEWLLRNRGNEFEVVDYREGNRPYAIWDSSKGEV
jgi:hypothetical protein